MLLFTVRPTPAHWTEVHVQPSCGVDGVAYDLLPDPSAPVEADGVHGYAVISWLVLKSPLQRQVASGISNESDYDQSGTLGSWFRLVTNQWTGQQWPRSSASSRSPDHQSSRR
jgi:hypothetical protein